MKSAIVRKALRISLVVGPILIVVNNLDYFLQGYLPPFFALKALLSFTVPFCVAWYSSETRFDEYDRDFS